MADAMRLKTSRRTINASFGVAETRKHGKAMRTKEIYYGNGPFDARCGR